MRLWVVALKLGKSLADGIQLCARVFVDLVLNGKAIFHIKFQVLEIFT